MGSAGGTGGLSTSGAGLGPLVDKPPVPPHTPIYMASVDGASHTEIPGISLRSFGIL